MAERFNNKVVLESMSRDVENSGLRITVEEFNTSAEDTAELQEAITQIGGLRQEASLAKMKKEKVGNENKGHNK